MKRLAIAALLVFGLAFAAHGDVLINQGFEYMFPPVGWTLVPTGLSTWMAC